MTYFLLCKMEDVRQNVSLSHHSYSLHAIKVNGDPVRQSQTCHFFVSQKAIQVYNLVREESTIQYETWFCITCKIFTFYLLIAHHNCLLSILTIAYLHSLTPCTACIFLAVSLSFSFCLFLSLCDWWAPGFD